LLGGALKLVGGLLIGLSLAAYLLQDKLIFLPRALATSALEEIAARHAHVDDIFLQARDGTRLHAWQLRATAGAPLVLYFGGNAEQVAWLLDELPQHDTGAAWLLVDYRGYGASEGAPSERALNADALVWYDYAARTNTRIYAFGRSLGTGVAVHVASQRRLQGLILVTPYDSLAAVGARHYPFLPVRLLLRHRFDSLGLAPQIRAPLLCIAATHDEIVPTVHAKRLYEAWAGPKEWFEVGAGHNDVDAHPGYWPRVQAFIAGR
jgi:pimeloyl-ACP methyl ester carboxylesterase